MHSSLNEADEAIMGLCALCVYRASYFVNIVIKSSSKAHFPIGQRMANVMRCARVFTSIIFHWYFLSIFKISGQIIAAKIKWKLNGMTLVSSASCFSHFSCTHSFVDVGFYHIHSWTMVNIANWDSYCFLFFCTFSLLPHIFV